MGVTVKDVARVAGVSTATVSRALRGFESVDPAVRAHVLDVAQRLDYVGSPAAAALTTGKAGSVGLITPFVDRLGFQRMLAGIESEMRGSDLDLLLHCTGDPSEPHPVPPHKRLARRVDGFIVLSISADSRDLEQILRLGMPVSMFGSRGADTSSVRVDDRAGASRAIDHLVDLGHRRLGIIYGREAVDAGVLEHEMHVGVRDAAERARISLDQNLIVAGDYTTSGGAIAMEQLLAGEDPPTAVFAFSDEMAYGAMRTMREHGLVPGRDIDLIGYDGHPMSDVLDLSTIELPFEEIGSTLARNLLDELQTPTGTHRVVTLPTRLAVRGSTTGASAP
ncbi:LacI family DNA-binding transcriptional regulator [Demequina muriae]|uniref:LacI family DNA-binding transcriptional regulator n=1 Tax=Demequina muriae TaxID=3051664 RepID=A0ABT8GE22_9MICO|nr:LacI family DNA-binding transcriptional regulator [Demequina sp. EGI L300058]MDN4479673.1 LacI family DNA-binding transcriptional regulator [Demequina sp. EGI L300058]